MKKNVKNLFFKVYELSFLLSPWILVFSITHYHFHRMLPGQRFFLGDKFFDFFSLIDFFIVFLILLYAIGRITKMVPIVQRKMPKVLAIGIFLFLIAGLLEIFLQKSIDPVLTTPFSYFSLIIIYPVLYFLLIFASLNDRYLHKFVKSYVSMVSMFSFIALIQYFTGIFPGEQFDFTHRMVWPFVDFMTMKATSANWIAFFIMPVFVLSILKILFLGNRFFVEKKLSNYEKFSFGFYFISSILTGLSVYLTQSYGSYLAIFVVVLFYLFRLLNLKKFIVVFLLLSIFAGGVFVLQKNSLKYKIMTNSVEFKFDNSVVSRENIYAMNFYIVSHYPMLGVGLNQYQSFFAENYEKVFHKKFGEKFFPPHAHNFFLSFFTTMGVFGFLGMFFIVVSVFLKNRFSVYNPAIFVLLAIMIHGLIDSYFWQEEVVFTFWIIVFLSFTYRYKRIEK